MSKGDRSTGTRDRILHAVLRLMGKPTYLENFGLSREAISQAADCAPGTVDYHVRGSLLADGLFELHRDTMLGVVRQQARDYQDYTEDFMAPDGSNLREVLKKALVRDLRTYLPQHTDEAAVGRERLYWIGVALAGRPVVRGRSDVRGALRRTNAATQAEYRDTYRAVIAAARRGPMQSQDEIDYDRIQRIVNAFLEGVIVHRRLHMPLTDDDIVDGLLAIVYAMTTPLDGAPTPT